MLPLSRTAARLSTCAFLNVRALSCSGGAPVYHPSGAKSLNLLPDKLAAEQISADKAHCDALAELAEQGRQLDQLAKVLNQMTLPRKRKPYEYSIQHLNRTDKLDKILPRSNAKQLKGLRKNIALYFYEDDSEDLIAYKRRYLKDKLKADALTNPDIAGYLGVGLLKAIVAYLEKDPAGKEISAEDKEDVEDWWKWLW